MSDATPAAPAAVRTHAEDGVLTITLNFRAALDILYAGFGLLRLQPRCTSELQ